MDKIRVEITVTVHHAGFNYNYEDRVQKDVVVEGYYPALVYVPFDEVCQGLAHATLNEFYVNQLKEEENETD